MTYGDGLRDVDITAHRKFHDANDGLVTMTVVRPPARFGSRWSTASASWPSRRSHKHERVWINGGFFVVSPEALKYIDGDDTPWETEPLRRLVADDQLRAWQHTGFWQPMDTLREKELLESMWERGAAPWNGHEHGD